LWALSKDGLTSAFYMCSYSDMKSGHHMVCRAKDLELSLIKTNQLEEILPSSITQSN